jgi:hypothetical protein
MRSFLAGIVLALALVAAGCGGGSSNTTTTNGTTNASSNGEASKPAVQVLADAVKAADSASSLHMSGNVSSGKNPVGIDLSIAKGNGATGSMTINGKKVDLVIVGSNGYMKGDGSFWTQFGGAAGATIAQLLQGKWLKFPVNNAQFHPIIAFSSAKALFDKLKSGADKHLQNSGVTTYKGQSVVALDDGAKNGTLYVAATGTPYPVALVKTGSDGGTITFSAWNEPVSLTAPTNVLDFSKLTG